MRCPKVLQGQRLVAISPFQLLLYAPAPSSSPALVFLDIFLPQTKTAYVNFRLKMASYIHTSVDVLRPQLPSMAGLSYHMELVNLRHALYRWYIQENLPLSVTPTAELQFLPIQGEATASVPLVAPPEDYDLSLLSIGHYDVMSSHPRTPNFLGFSG